MSGTCCVTCWGCRKREPQAGRLTAGTYSPSGAGNPKSSVAGPCSFWRLQGRALPVPCIPWLVGALIPFPLPSRGLLLCSIFTWPSHKDMGPIGLGSTLLQYGPHLSLIISARTLLPDEITLTGSKDTWIWGTSLSPAVFRCSLSQLPAFPCVVLVTAGSLGEAHPVEVPWGLHGELDVHCLPRELLPTA